MENFDTDGISLLPDCLLHHIMSFLDTVQVVRTCVLSRRWKTVWTHVPTLDFDYNSYESQMLNRRINIGRTWELFKYFMVGVLCEHRGSSIIKLSYSADVQESFPNLLISYAGFRFVRELCISVESCSFEWNFLSVCRSLNVLKLLCDFQIYEYDCRDLVLPSLKILKLETSVFCEWNGLKIYENWLSCFPNLESLVMVNFFHEGCTSICAPKLENFELHDTTAEELYFSEFELATPNLRCVKFNNVLPTLKSDLDLPCLESVNIAIDDFIFTSQCEEARENLVQLLRLFHSARSITMPLNAAEVLLLVHSPLKIYFHFHNLRLLKLETKKSCEEINLPIDELQRLFECPTLEIVVTHLN